ncbi:MAG: hypothetical protein ACYC5Q_15070 [Thermoleophilia bacterium]
MAEDSPGQTIFNSNTTADVLDAFLRADASDKSVSQLLSWYILSQRDDGSWVLGANSDFHADLVTWPTNEAIYVLSLADSFARQEAPRKSSIGSWIFIGVVLLSIVEALLLLGAPGYLVDAWTSLSEKSRDVILISVIVGLIVNLLANILYSFMTRRR